MAHGLGCSVACGIFPDQSSNLCPLHWQADSQPLRHQGSPGSIEDQGKGHILLNINGWGHKQCEEGCLQAGVEVTEAWNGLWSLHRVERLLQGLVSSTEAECSMETICGEGQGYGQSIAGWQ